MTPESSVAKTHSYNDLRSSIGWIGSLLPFVLVLGAVFIFDESAIRESISQYYLSAMRDVFVGALCAVGLFMFFYAGHDWRDNWMGNIGGFFAICTAWFHVSATGDATWYHTVHYICAVLFFISLILFSLWLFPLKGPSPTPQKLKRNIIYYVCGVIMVVSLVMIPVYHFLLSSSIPDSKLVFWCEAVALVFFGFSWLTKGGLILRDPPPTP